MEEVEQCRDFGKARPGIKIKYTFAANSSLTAGAGWAAYWTDSAPILFRAIPPPAGTALWVTGCGEITLSFVAGYGIPKI